MMGKNKKGNILKFIHSYLPILFILVLWEGIVRLGLVNEQLLPPFSKILIEWVNLVRAGEMRSE